MLYDPRQEEVNRDLLNAAGIVRQGGLCKHALWKDGRHCINGALISAIAGQDSLKNWGGDDRRRVVAAQNRVCEHLGLMWSEQGYIAPLVDWNNEPERTKGDVVDALCAAAGVTSEVLV